MPPRAAYLLRATATPVNTTRVRGFDVYPEKHAEARCQNREKCVGPGCRVDTGKTERKRNAKHTN